MPKALIIKNILLLVILNTSSVLELWSVMNNNSKSIAGECNNAKSIGLYNQSHINQSLSISIFINNFKETVIRKR